MLLIYVKHAAGTKFGPDSSFYTIPIPCADRNTPIAADLNNDSFSYFR
jgi:hypothetical protein